MTDEAFNAALAKMAKALQKKPYTAKALAKELKVCKQTVYSRLAAMKEYGYKITEANVREGMSGPLAKAYSIEGRS